MNGNYNQREEGRRRSQSKSMDDRENSRKIQEGGNIIHSISMNDMRNNSIENNIRQYNENDEIGGLKNTNDSL